MYIGTMYIYFNVLFKSEATYRIDLIVHFIMFDLFYQIQICMRIPYTMYIESVATVSSLPDVILNIMIL